MRCLQLTAPGDRPSPGTDTVVLVDERPVKTSWFIGPYDEVTTSPRIAIEGDWVRLAPEAVEDLQRTQERPTRAVFFCSSDTHVRTFAALRGAFEDTRFVVRSLEDFGAIDALDNEGIPWERHGPAVRGFPDADVAVTGMDWAIEEKLFIARARRRGIPVACLQESVIDLGTETRRMQWADYAFLQGPETLRYLQRRCSFLVGNPRYDELEPVSLPEGQNVLINCNFTFGIYEDAARDWVERAVAACRSVGAPFFVSRHPRTRVDLDGIPNVEASGAYVVHEQLRRASVIVTRFSSLAHEALLLGRHVIYFNPHGETMRYLRDDTSGLLMKADTSEALARALSKTRAPPPSRTFGDANEAYRRLFTATDGRNGQRCAAAMRMLARYGARYPSTDLEPLSELRLSAELLKARVRPTLERVPGARRAWRATRKTLKF